MTASQKTVYLETMGCQMNVLDSELVMGQLKRMGYAATADMGAADLVLLNTCSVREHAEAKVYSRLGQLKRPRQEQPEKIIGVIGCMAERDAEGLLDGAHPVDLICGPGQLNRVPTLIAEVESQRSQAQALASSGSRKLAPAERSLVQYDSLEALDLSRDPDPDDALQSYIRVQRGCDKFCTFCVVPFTRGPELSRDPSALVEEAHMLADRGCKEVTLVGQTVNSYAHMEDGRKVVFSELLARLNDVPGLERIRFVTSYPGDFGDDVLEAMRDLPKVCEYLHIPAQSGSDPVLQRMRRQYSVTEYIELMHRAREFVPGIQLASDFIVGFSGETDEEFEETVKLVEHVQYKNLFCFKYSPRPGTVADRRQADDVPETLKRQRNQRLLAVQERISLSNNQPLIGQRFEILVEGFSKAALKAQEAEQSRGHEVSWRRSDQLVGRTRGDQIVVFNGSDSLIGQLIEVQVVSATALTLHAELPVATPVRDAHELPVIS
jgi:tRNA-2-methylthio-N6-dimethylallyladenosine synthase